MTVSVWRIVKAKYAMSAMTGEGARLNGGRWNSSGRPIVYTSSSASLATLEMLVHLDRTSLLAAYILMEVVMPEKLIMSIDPDELPDDWHTTPAPVSLQAIGDRWYDKQQSVGLKVPSAIVPSETNILLNPTHPKFTQLTVGEPVAHWIDSRLF